MLHDIRKTLGLSQAAMAEALGISQATYSQIEKSNDLPPSKHILTLYKTFGVSPLYILANEGNMFANDSKEKISLLIKQLQAEIDNL